MGNLSVPPIDSFRLYSCANVYIICHPCLFFGEISVQMFAHLVTGLFVFLFLIKFLHIHFFFPDTDVSFASIFSQLATLLLIFSTVCFEKTELYFSEVQSIFVPSECLWC